VQQTLDLVAPLCGKPAWHCRCVLDVNHDGAHTCDCGGSWTFNERGQFVALSFPRVVARPQFDNAEPTP
jgi:hypothetical protein